MVKYLEDSEDLKVSLGELKEQLESPEEAGFSIMQIAKQARNERGQKLFQIFRQGENEVYIASLVRWDTQRRCQDLMQEVKLPSERQDVLTGMVVRRGTCRKKHPKSAKRRFSRNSRSQRSKEQKKLWNSCKRSISS